MPFPGDEYGGRFAWVPPRQGHVYFAWAMGTRYLKVGFTRSRPEIRVMELQTGCPHELILVAAIPGTRDDEKAVHQRFETQRTIGEWFYVSDEMNESLFVEYGVDIPGCSAGVI